MSIAEACISGPLCLLQGLACSVYVCIVHPRLTMHSVRLLRPQGRIVGTAVAAVVFSFSSVVPVSAFFLSRLGVLRTCCGHLWAPSTGGKRERE